jgi:sugar phosphate isomerase/epimerase
LKDNLQARMDFANELGLTQMVVSSFGLSKEAKLDDWKRAANETNVLGEQSKKNGLQMVFHNHNQEFEKLEGQMIYDVLLNQLDPTLTKMQFQVWVVIAGYKAADYFRKHPGRFISAHLSDWSGVAEEQVSIGKGKVDWKDFFEASKAGGLKNFYVEMDMPVLKDSAAYLKRLG